MGGQVRGLRGGQRSRTWGWTSVACVAGVLSQVPGAFAEEAASPERGAASAVDEASSGVPTSDAEESSGGPRPYEPGEPIPPGYHPDTRAHHGLVTGGAVLFGLSHFASMLSGLVLSLIRDPGGGQEQTANPYWPLGLPMAGPFVTAGLAEPEQVGKAIGMTALVIDGVVQCAGVAMLVAGLADQEDVLVPDAVGRPRVWLLPWAHAQGAGIDLDGSF